MRKVIFLLAFMLPATAIGCEVVSSYQVQETSFRKLPFDQAIAKLLANTPFTASITDVGAVKITANQVSGRLDTVLSSMGERYRIAYSQDGCTLNFSDAAASETKTEYVPVCADLTLYKVGKTSFDALPVVRAVETLLKGTPFKVESSVDKKALLRAKDIQGDLDFVLNKLASEAGLSFKRNNCVISIQEGDGSEAPPSGKTKIDWTIAKEDRWLSVALARWAKDAGWQPPVWELKKDGAAVDFPLDRDGRYPGSFADALKEVAKSYATADTPFDIIMYTGNRMIRVVPTGAAK